MDFRLKDKCMVCDTRIRKYDGKKWAHLEEYQTVDVDIDNGTRMTIGVCTKHTTPTISDMPTLNQRLQQMWLEEVELGLGDEQWVREQANKLTVLGVSHG